MQMEETSKSVVSTPAIKPFKPFVIIVKTTPFFSLSRVMYVWTPSWGRKLRVQVNFTTTTKKNKFFRQKY